MLLKPAFRLDITWRRLGLLAALALLPLPRFLLGLSGRKHLGHALFCDSVRAGFVSLLQSLRLERGSELIFTFPTITAMPALAEDLGYTVVPADCELDNHPASVASLRKLITEKTRAVVFAPLFGCRTDLAPYRVLCDEHGILLIEDAAQGYQGKGWPERGHAHFTFFSFGLLKRSSCLKGGLLLCESRAEKKKCRVIQREYRTSSRKNFLKSWWLAAVGKFCTGGPLVYGFLDGVTRKFDKPLSSLLLAIARPKRATVAAAEFMVQPNNLTIAAMRWALRKRARGNATYTCCRQRPPHKSLARVGIWPSVALGSKVNLSRHAQRGYDFVAASVRLASSFRNEATVLTNRNATRFVEQAYFVDSSFYGKR